MKKRLLITSIVMMLVCAVALSTATYAWFTSNASVSASTMTLKAATSEASSLGIGWTGYAAGTSVVSDIYRTLDPMAPNVIVNNNTVPLEDGVTVYETTGKNGESVHNLNFFTSTVKQENGMYVFNNNGANVEPVVYTKDNTKAVADDSTERSFYVRNLSKANEVKSIKVSAVFPGSVTNGVQYAITTDTVPDANKNYYLKNGNTYSLITGESRLLLLQYGFDSSKTYYEDNSAYVLSQDTEVNPDSVYYQFTLKTFAQITGDKFEKVTVNNVVKYQVTADEEAKANKDYFEISKVATPTENPKTSNYYEKLTGDNMIRVALFKKEYRITTDTTFNSTKLTNGKYFVYDPTTSVIKEIKLVYSSTEAGNSITNLPYSVFEADENHTLLGVLGKGDTEYHEVASGTPFDINEVYFTAAYETLAVTDAASFAKYKALGLLYKDENGGEVIYEAVAISDTYQSSGYSYKVVTAQNFERWKANGIYTESAGVYTKVANDGTYNSEATYYIRNYAQCKEYTEISVNDSGFETAKTTYAGRLYTGAGDIYTAVANDAEFNSEATYYVKGFVSGTQYYTAVNTVANGKIEIDGEVRKLNYYNQVATDITFADHLQPGEQVDIIAVVWLDGTILDDTRSGELAQVSLLFEANSKDPR